MQITQLYSGQNRISGDFIYRIEMPAKGLSAIEGVEVKNIDLLQLKNFACLLETPLLILHHISDADLLPVVAHRKKNGLPTVYELADNFKVSHLGRPDALKKGPPDYHHIIELLISRCDAVQTTSQALKERYLTLNSKIFVFPNQIDSVQSPHKSLSDTVTIGWAGSTRHYEDIKFYATELAAWIKANPDTRIALMATKAILDLFYDVPKSQLIVKKPGSLTGYLDFLSTLDIGLAPLLANEFNACRSDVKFLEYASRCVLPVCSGFGPYIELKKEHQDLLLFETPAQLVEQLGELCKEKNRRQTLAKNAFDFVQKSRHFKTYNWQSRIAKYAALFKNTNHWVDFQSTAKSSFCSAVAYNLLTKTTSNQSKNKIVDLKKAISIEPENYQAYYFYGAALLEAGCFSDAEIYLKNALKLNPASLRSAKFLAQSYLFRGKMNSSIKAVRTGLKVEPNFPILDYIQAVSLAGQNKNKLALAFAEKIVKRVPDYVEAQFLFGRLAIKEKQTEKVAAAIKQLKMLVPESADVSLLQAELAIAEHDFSEALNRVSQALILDPYHGLAKNILTTINEKLKSQAPAQTYPA